MKHKLTYIFVLTFPPHQLQLLYCCGLGSTDLVCGREELHVKVSLSLRYDTV
jgi:hypothetical protein